MATGSVLSITVLGAVADDAGHTVDLNGALVAIKFEGMGRRHPRTDPLFDGSTLDITVQSPGFDATGTATTVTRHVYGVNAAYGGGLRNTYPNNWSTLGATVPPRSYCSAGTNGNQMYFTDAGGTKGATPLTGSTVGSTYSDGGVSWLNVDPLLENAGYVEQNTGSDVIVYAILDFPIYQGDTIVSAAISANAYRSTYDASGTQVTQRNSLASSGLTVTNNSTLQYEVPIVHVITPPHLASQGSYDFEIVAGHAWAQSGREVACVKMQAWNAARTTGSTVVTVADTSISAYGNTSSPAGTALEVHRGTLNTTGLGAGDAFVEYEVYPWLGTRTFKSRLDGEGRDWVASTAYSGTREVVRNGANFYYLTTSGTSAASGGPVGTGTGITDGTAVWAYFGNGATKQNSSNPQARHHFLNELGTYTRGFAVANGTGTNVGTPQVWPTSAAALAVKATASYGTVRDAAAAIQTFHNTASGSLTLHSDIGGGTVYRLAGTHTGVSTGTSMKLLTGGSEWMYILPDPAAAAGSVILAYTATAAFKAAGPRVWDEGFTANGSSGAIYSTSETASAVGQPTTELYLNKFTYTNGNITTQVALASGVHWMRNATVTNGILAQTEGQRSHCVDMIGSSVGGPAKLALRSSLGIRAVGDVQVLDPASTWTPGRMFYTGGASFITGSQTVITPLFQILLGSVPNPYMGAYVSDLLVESLNGTSSEPCARIGADGADLDMTNVVIHNTTGAGERFSIGYNDGTPLTPLRRQWFFANNLHSTRPAIDDYAAHPTSTTPRGAGRFRNYWISYSIGFRDNVTLKGTDSYGGGVSPSIQRYGRRDVWGPKQTPAEQAAQFVLDKSVNVYASSGNTGGGDYHPAVSSVARGAATIQNKRYDMYGAQRQASGTVGALESLTVELLFAGGSTTSAGTWTLALGKTLLFAGGATTSAGTWTLAPGLGLTFAGGAVTSSGTWTLALAKALSFSGGANTSAGTWTLYIPPPPYRFAGLRNYAAFALPPENYRSSFTP